jgi:acid phosphatase family membrane protein YuiD
MKIAYVIAPFVAWVAAGSLKFLINTLRAGRLAWKQIGYGGLPSTHTSVVSATAFLVGLKDGWDTPAFGVALTLAFIVVLDAVSLRRRLGEHAAALNRLHEGEKGWRPLRERLGHRPVEVAAGVATGLGCAALLHWAL